MRLFKCLAVAADCLIKLKIDSMEMILSVEVGGGLYVETDASLDLFRKATFLVTCGVNFVLGRPCTKRTLRSCAPQFPGISLFLRSFWKRSHVLPWANNSNYLFFFCFFFLQNQVTFKFFYLLLFVRSVFAYVALVFRVGCCKPDGRGCDTKNWKR